MMTGICAIYIFNDDVNLVLHSGLLKVYFHEKWAEQFSTPETISQKLSSISDSSPVPIRFLGGKVFGLCATVSINEALILAKKLLQSWN